MQAIVSYLVVISCLSTQQRYECPLSEPRLYTVTDRSYIARCIIIIILLSLWICCCGILSQSWLYATIISITTQQKIHDLLQVVHNLLRAVTHILLLEFKVQIDTELYHTTRYRAVIYKLQCVTSLCTTLLQIYAIITRDSSACVS